MEVEGPGAAIALLGLAQALLGLYLALTARPGLAAVDGPAHLRGHPRAAARIQHLLGLHLLASGLLAALLSALLGPGAGAVALGLAGLAALLPLAAPRLAVEEELSTPPSGGEHALLRPPRPSRAALLVGAVSLVLGLALLALAAERLWPYTRAGGLVLALGLAPAQLGASLLSILHPEAYAPRERWLPVLAPLAPLTVIIIVYLLARSI